MAHRARSGQCQDRCDEGRWYSFQGNGQENGVSEVQLLLCRGVQNGYAVLPKRVKQDRMHQNLVLSFSIDAADMSQIATMYRGDGVAWASRDPSKKLETVGRKYGGRSMAISLKIIAHQTQFQASLSE